VTNLILHGATAEPQTLAQAARAVEQPPAVPAHLGAARLGQQDDLAASRHPGWQIRPVLRLAGPGDREVEDGVEGAGNAAPYVAEEVRRLDA
jgi:hypothetical protein